MKLFAIFTFFLSAQLAVSAPLEQRNDKKKHAPLVKDFKDALEAKKIGADKLIFYTGGGKAHGLTKIQDVPVLDMDDPDGYKEDAAKKAVENWSRAFAEVSSGVAWVMFKDSSAIDETRKSVWVKEEWPGLKHNDDVEEIIQIDATDTSKIQQI
ncbi:hypothetical protein SLS58_001467 [Diplodia intermedia]|uniref:Uncharacterized protein n=1 Tax=Diplodia intermedia TaxID=856260 RepID=A0ABR3U184_9PEZI